MHCFCKWRYRVSLAVASTLWAVAPLASAQDSTAQNGKREYTVKRNVVYSTVGDMQLTLDAYLPDGAQLHPAVLVIHGGAWRSGSKYQLAGYARILAERGFAAFAINYRLAPKFKFPAQLDDCRAAVRFIRKNAAAYAVDTARLGAIGYSAGGHLSAMLGTTGAAPNDKNGQTDTRVQAVVAGGAPVEFRLMPKNLKSLSYWLGGTREELPEIYRLASPTAYVTAGAAPTLFFNGTRDSLVPPAFSLPMYLALKAAGVETEFHKIEGANHLTAAGNEEVLDKAWAFFEKHLNSTRGANSQEP